MLDAPTFLLLNYVLLFMYLYNIFLTVVKQTMGLVSTI